MVAPLIVGAARVVAGKKAGGKVKAAIERPELRRRIRARERRKERDKNPLTPEQKQMLFANSKRNLSRMRKSRRKTQDLLDFTNAKKIKAGIASSFIFWTVIWWNIPQLIFGLISLIGFGIENVWFAGWALPGEKVFAGFWFLVAMIGLSTMIYALLIYLIRGVNCLSGMKGVVFALCTAFYFIPLPLINAIPWFIGWSMIVTYAQGKDDTVTDKQEGDENGEEGSSEEMGVVA